MEPIPHYILSDYTINKANEYGLLIYPSDNPKYKLDIHDPISCKLLMRIGINGDVDYPFYLECVKTNLITLECAKKERENYLKQHDTREANIKGTSKWYINKLLW